MRPKPSNTTPQGDLFRSRLENILNHNHELYRLAELIPWDTFDQEFGALYAEKQGRPGIPIRLLVGLTYLGHTYGLSDEEVVRRWPENPYYQFFCGESYFQHKLPIAPSSLSRWRKRIGEHGAQFILKQTVSIGLRCGAVKESSLERVSVDTTVQCKAVRHPTDARLSNRSRERLVRLAREHNLPLRQSYARLGPKAELMAGRYLHARQGKRARREITGKLVERCYVDRGYRGHGVTDTAVFISGRRSGMTRR